MKIEDVMAKLRAEEPDKFYSVHIEPEWGGLPARTFFGIGACAFCVPGTFGDEERPDTAKRVMGYLLKVHEDKLNKMELVLLPKKAELKPGRSRTSPVLTKLVSSQDYMQADYVEHPFHVVTWVLKLALEVNSHFMGWRAPDSIYNPLHLRNEDEGMWGDIMPYLVKDNG